MTFLQIRNNPSHLLLNKRTQDTTTDTADISESPFLTGTMERGEVDANSHEEDNILLNRNYLTQSYSLITESLQKGCDVMQMPNGDIIVTETKTVTFQYRWDPRKEQIVRVQLNRSKKNDNEK